ncbi:Outer membrane porin protein [Pandoraea cepalis]|uniref:Outer membrane porin protein n=1 Tax=Pandoraea cepalis TaxID=2508294 RepID=A0A5E4X7E9_9BURK|nr:porin [Pandoraea cepalis]VVE32120.1 Outer membrane porin protein [Pandoraea cepalis]
MKKSLLALGVLGAFAGAAHAQSSVTLYGIIDGGFTYVNKTGGNVAGTGNATKNISLNSGNLQGSRWGLKGAEDLGGGLKAIFVLESGFNVNNGVSAQGGRLFGRQAYVGLSSATAGTVSIGRQYDSVVDFVGPFASGSQWATYSGAHPFDNDNLNNSFRINNSIKYTTANYNGFSAGALYGFSNSANNGSTGTGFANNRAWSVGMGYANGPLTLGAGYLYLGAPGSNSSGVLLSGDQNTAMTAGGLASSDKAYIASAGGSYAFGPATVGLVYSHSKYDYIGGGSWKFDNVELNGKYMLTPALQLGLAYTYTWTKLASGTTDISPKYHQVNLGVDYFLSKRTDTYLVGLWQHANNDAPGGASMNAQGFANSTNQFAVTAGIRHKF